jgi:hypothetical protein
MKDFRELMRAPSSAPTLEADSQQGVTDPAEDNLRVSPHLVELLKGSERFFRRGRKFRRQMVMVDVDPGMHRGADFFRCASIISTKIWSILGRAGSAFSTTF